MSIKTTLLALAATFGLTSTCFAMDTEAKIRQIIYTGDTIKVWLVPTNVASMNNDRFSCRATGSVEITSVPKEDLKGHLGILLAAQAQNKVVGFDHSPSANTCKTAVWTGILN